MHELDHTAFTLPDVTEFLAADDRILAFSVVDGDGDSVDITGAQIDWGLFEREYQTNSDHAVLSSDDSGVEVVTDERVDSEAGEFEIRLESDATEGLYGEYYQRPVVVDAADNRASWRGRIVVTA